MKILLGSDTAQNETAPSSGHPQTMSVHHYAGSKLEGLFRALAGIGVAVALAIGAVLVANSFASTTNYANCNSTNDCKEIKLAEINAGQWRSYYDAESRIKSRPAPPPLSTTVVAPAASAPGLPPPIRGNASENKVKTCLLGLGFTADEFYFKTGSDGLPHAYLNSVGLAKARQAGKVSAAQDCLR